MNAIDKLSEEELTILAIKGLIVDLPSETRENCERYISDIRSMLEEDSVAATAAIALCSAMLQANKDII